MSSGTSLGLALLVYAVGCAAGAGCSASREYVCPEPVGRIIRDDCETYRTRYEALSVELGASVSGLLNVKALLGESSLRDPSEVIQVLAHRTHALCKDFNACRVAPFEYRQRREQTDRVFTAVSAIQEQLKGPLDQESKARLVRELMRVLSEDAVSTGASGAGTGASGAISGGGGPGRVRPERPPGAPLHRSSAPWYGTKLLPPQPSGPASFPVLAGARFSLAYVIGKSSARGLGGYRPSATLYLAGPVEPDDMVTVEWQSATERGASNDCPVGRGSENGLALARCAAPQSLTFTADTFTIKVTFRRGADGKTALIGQRTVPVLSRQDDDARQDALLFGLDLDERAREGRLVFRPHEDWLPPRLEQPSLLVVLKLRKHMSTTARCWVDGVTATPGLKPSRYSGQEGTFRDRPRYRTIRPGVSQAVQDPHVQWWRFDFPLPFAVQREGAPPPEGMRAWPQAGDWRCVVSIEGEPARELTFKVGGDGRPSVHPRQLERPDAGWLVETRVLPNPFEVPIR